MNTDPGEYALDGYLALLRDRPDWFANHPAGGIEILTNPGEIALARAAALSHRAAAGLDVSDTRAGLLAKDPYMTVVRDAVRFPDGSLGLYNRIVETSPVAVLPLLDDLPVLIRVFRHGLRDWSLEFPRGGADRGETPEAAARREVIEETGATKAELQPLGEFTPGGSSLSIRAHLFVARIDQIGVSDPLEGIEEAQAYPVADVERLIGDGVIIDGFTMALFLRARLRQLI
ncbi:MAG: NUDIX hydrolase [Bradyrhizobium sp.]